MLALACDTGAAGGVGGGDAEEGGVLVASGGEDNQLLLWRLRAEALRAAERPAAAAPPAAPAPVAGGAMHRLACAACAAHLGWVDVRGTALYALCDGCHARQQEEAAPLAHGHGHAEQQSRLHGPEGKSGGQGKPHEHGHCSSQGCC